MMTPKEIAEKIISSDAVCSLEFFRTCKTGYVEHAGLQALAADWLKAQEPLGDERIDSIEKRSFAYQTIQPSEVDELVLEIRLLRAAAQVDRAEIERLKAELDGVEEGDYLCVCGHENLYHCKDGCTAEVAIDSTCPCLKFDAARATDTQGGPK